MKIYFNIYIYIFNELCYIHLFSELVSCIIRQTSVALCLRRS